MIARSILILVSAALLAADGAAPRGWAAVPGGSTPAAAAVATGSIEGHVESRAEPARRRADRYAAAAAPVRTVQAIQSVVFLRGTAGGPAAGSAVARSVPARLMQQDTAFVPAVVVIGTGTTVEFPNRDPFFHNVFSYSSAKRFDLGRFPQGESRAVRFDEPGIVRIYCEVHETMRSAVIVTENPYWAIIAEDGRFSIADVPAGRWELEVWHADRKGQVVPVTIEDGRVTRVTLALP